MANILGPKDFTLHVQELKGTVSIKFTAKASFAPDSDDYENAIDNLTDYLWEEEDFYETDDFVYETDLDVEQTNAKLKELGFDL